MAFVDILGWSKAMESNSAATLYDALEPLRLRGEFHNEAYRQQVQAEYGNRLNPQMLMTQYGFFSDCFVFSMPVEMGGRIYNAVSEIMVAFLRNGFALRGGIAVGSLFHRDQIVFGNGLVAAYRIESDMAKFSRIMVDESVIAEIGIKDYDAVIKDHLGNWVVDPFPWYAKGDDMKGLLQQMFTPSQIIEVIRKKLTEFSGEPRLRDMWRFQAEVCARSLEKYGDVARDWVAELRTLIRVGSAGAT